MWVLILINRSGLSSQCLFQPQLPCTVVCRYAEVTFNSFSSRLASPTRLLVIWLFLVWLQETILKAYRNFYEKLRVTMRTILPSISLVFVFVLFFSITLETLTLFTSGCVTNSHVPWFRCERMSFVMANSPTLASNSDSSMKFASMGSPSSPGASSKSWGFPKSFSPLLY